MDQDALYDELMEIRVRYLEIIDGMGGSYGERQHMHGCRHG